MNNNNRPRNFLPRPGGPMNQNNAMPRFPFPQQQQSPFPQMGGNQGNQPQQQNQLAALQSELQQKQTMLGAAMAQLQVETLKAQVTQLQCAMGQPPTPQGNNNNNNQFSGPGNLGNMMMGQQNMMMSGMPGMGQSQNALQNLLMGSMPQNMNPGGGGMRQNSPFGNSGNGMNNPSQRFPNSMSQNFQNSNPMGSGQMNRMQGVRPHNNPMNHQNNAMNQQNNPMNQQNNRMNQQNNPMNQQNNPMNQQMNPMNNPTNPGPQGPPFPIPTHQQPPPIPPSGPSRHGGPPPNMTSRPRGSQSGSTNRMPGSMPPRMPGSGLLGAGPPAMPGSGPPAMPGSEPPSMPGSPNVRPPRPPGNVIAALNQFLNNVTNPVAGHANVPPINAGPLNNRPPPNVASSIVDTSLPPPSFISSHKHVKIKREFRSPSPSPKSSSGSRHRSNLPQQYQTMNNDKPSSSRSSHRGGRSDFDEDNDLEYLLKDTASDSDASKYKQTSRSTNLVQIVGNKGRSGGSDHQTSSSRSGGSDHQASSSSRGQSQPRTSRQTWLDNNYKPRQSSKLEQSIIDSFDKSELSERPRSFSTSGRRSRSPHKRSRSSVSSRRSPAKRSRRSPSRGEHDSPLVDVKQEPSSRPSSPPRGNTISGKPDLSELEDKYDPPEDTISYITKSCPADLYFSRVPGSGNTEGTHRMKDLEGRFEEAILKRKTRVRDSQPPVETPVAAPYTAGTPCCHHGRDHDESSSCSSSSSEDGSEEEEEEEEVNVIISEWERRKQHPFSLHPELWFNLEGQANDGQLCRCSIKSKQSGIRHDIYPGEQKIPLCDPGSNNLDHLHHYRVTLSPTTNLLTRTPTLINHDDHEFIFEGFSLFSHRKLDHIPPCKLHRFNIEYTIHFVAEKAPENFTVRSLNLLSHFLFSEILELVDLDMAGKDGGCPRFHFLPRFSRTLPDSGCKEVLSMNTVLSFLLRSAGTLVDDEKLEEALLCGDDQWRSFLDEVRGMIVTHPGMRPSSIRIDQLDRKFTEPTDDNIPAPSFIMDRGGSEKRRRFPLIIHQGYRPAQLSYAGDPAYRKAWKQYVKYRHLLNSKPKILLADKQKLKEFEDRLQDIRLKKTMKREITVELSSQGFLLTGIRADVCQHALMMPVLMAHLRFHLCLDNLETSIGYKFQDRYLLQLALTHTSYRTNYGTNPDHTRNSLTNCGMRQVEYGDRRIHYQNTRKRGICILVDIMSRMGRQEETTSEIPHNERLEFLGDAVIEFLTSVHLFYMFPWLEEGGLTTYRMALVQNQHLALVAKKLKLQDYMLYVHGPDLCHESDLKHAMANCCEALMGALFLDGGLGLVDRIFSHTLFDDSKDLLDTWRDVPRHTLQQEEPAGDRHWVASSHILQKLENFEDAIGIKFTHIRLLAKAFTHRNIGENPLTRGHNQRLEFLGDTVMQLVASEFLYKHFPEHHEGHLSLLRSSLVNSRTQSLVYDDLGMGDYVIFNDKLCHERIEGIEMKTKQRADVLESFVGALYVDKGLDYCRTFCHVCFFPRLKDFIMNQDWNDPKSQLQQCCLTLRVVGGGEPDIPVYKVIESIGPTNTRKYVVAVYFRGSRLATGSGHSIQQAEMDAAEVALKKRAELFPILKHQKRFLEKIKNGQRMIKPKPVTDAKYINKRVYGHGPRRRKARKEEIATHKAINVYEKTRTQDNSKT